MSEFVNVGGEVIREGIGEGAVMTVFSDPVCQLSFSPDLTTWTFSGEIPLPPKPSRGQEVAEKMICRFADDPDGKDGFIIGEERNGVWVRPSDYSTGEQIVKDKIAAAIDAEIARERERCAKIAHEGGWDYIGSNHDIAHRIRSGE